MIKAYIQLLIAVILLTITTISCSDSKESNNIIPPIIDPDEYGSADFGFGIVETFNFPIVVKKYNGIGWESVSATITVETDDGHEFIYEVGSETTQLSVADGHGTYTIKTTVSGYDLFEKTYSAEELKDGTPIVISISEIPPEIVEDTENWDIRIKSSDKSLPRKIAVDSMGNVYIAGSYFQWHSNEDYSIHRFIKKFDKDGNEYNDWNIIFDSTDRDVNHGVYALAIDNSDNVYLSGIPTDIIKFNRKGEEIQKKSINFPDGYDHRICDLEFDGKGNIVVAYSINQASNKILKLDSSLNIIKKNNGISDWLVEINDYTITAVAVNTHKDSDGSIWAIGMRANWHAPSFLDWFLININSGDGDFNYFHDYITDNNDIPISGTVDTDGTLYVVGRGNEDKEWTIVSYATNGIWKDILPVENNPGAYDIVVDGDNIFTTAPNWFSNGSSHAILRHYNKTVTNDTKFAGKIGKGYGISGSATAVTVSQSSNIFVTGKAITKEFENEIWIKKFMYQE